MTVFIKKGDAPLSVRQAVKRGAHILALELAQAGARDEDRELLRLLPPADLPPRLSAVLAALGHQTYADYAAAWEADNMVNGENNVFNHQLAAYRKAVARLSRYRLADGRPEITEDQDGETVVTQTAIDPLPATNPAVAADDSERAAAQAVIDATPQEVKDFA